jgi:hypothetical protein
MEFNKLVFGGLALGCLAAAGAGGYLAARQESPIRAESAIAEPAVNPAAAEAPRAVAESEGVIAPATPAPTAPAAVPESPAASSPRRESTPRPSRPSPAPSSVPVAPVTRTSRAEPAAPAASPADSAPSPSSGGMWEPRASVEPERAPATHEPEPPPAPAAPELVELVIPSDAVLGLQIERTVSSELARVEDRVDARVTRDVRVDNRVAIPAGSIVQGSVLEVERGGKMRERAKLGIRFHTVVLADGTRLNIKTDSVVREGASPSGESAAKIGGAAAGGAILGAILGGGKGAVLGGTAATMSGNRNPAVLPAGSTVSVRVQQPVTVTVEK